MRKGLYIWLYRKGCLRKVSSQERTAKKGTRGVADGDACMHFVRVQTSFLVMVVRVLTC